jgi:hypothetical protein
MKGDTFDEFSALPTRSSRGLLHQPASVHHIVGVTSVNSCIVCEPAASYASAVVIRSLCLQTPGKAADLQSVACICLLLIYCLLTASKCRLRLA